MAGGPQVAPYLLRAIAGRTVVAHNARFDLNFLEHEFQRADVTLAPGIPAVCTMEWSTRFLVGASRKFADCCSAAGVVHDSAHSAVGDALATAHLLAYYLKTGGVPPPWAATLNAAAR